MAEGGMEPGFYQGRLKGRKTGRVSPREAKRAPRWEAVLAKHGLMESGKADPNQGQLFDVDKVVGPAKSEEQLMRERGAPPPLVGSAPGFMPGIERATEKATKKAKITGLQKLATARERAGTSRGGPAVQETMQDRQAAYDAGKPADWYMPVSDGQNVVGESAAMKAMRAATPESRVSPQQFIRTVAITSPRTAWDEGGAPGTTDYKMPNIESAKSAASAFSAVAGQPDASPSSAIEAAASAPGQALAQSMRKAGEHLLKPTTSPIEIASPKSQKVPNFEQALLMGTEDKTLTKGMAGSYTVDTWDTRSAGLDEGVLNTDAGYAAAKMTGRRAALKNWELPSNFQSRTWVVEREKEPVESMGQNRLFQSSGGKVVPNPSAMPAEKVSPQQFKKSKTAEEFGLEF
jgi:hypothetical protein